MPLRQVSGSQLGLSTFSTSRFYRWFHTCGQQLPRGVMDAGERPPKIWRIHGRSSRAGSEAGHKPQCSVRLRFLKACRKHCQKPLLRAQSFSYYPRDNGRADFEREIRVSPPSVLPFIVVNRTTTLCNHIRDFNRMLIS
jgi:hypothetical protein